MVLVRFAPSPTGPLHLGGLRMALYNYLFARKHGGKWIMRVEDTDATRTVPGSVDGIRKALDWAGLDYDYGPHKGGPHTPYFQSERRDLYLTYSKKLLDAGHAYRCFCSPDKLAATRERLARSGSNHSYDRTCLHISEEEAIRKVRAGEKYVVRVNDTRRPDRKAAKDIIFGTLQEAVGSVATDSVIMKSDFFPTYHLASVVDDHEMGITHVLRGEEWLTSLPLHLDLYSYLGLEPPQFAHVPILLNADGTKMSKRHGNGQVVDYIRRGWEPQALLNWLALAGWGVPNDSSDSSGQKHKAPDSTSVMTLAEMISSFDISVITQRSSGLDPGKLEYINKHHIINSASSPEGLHYLANKIHDQIKDIFPLSLYTSIPHIESVIRALDGRLINLTDIPTLVPFFFADPDLTSEEAKAMLKNVPSEQHAPILDAIIQTIEDVPLAGLSELKIEQKKLQVSSKAFLTALRHALTGMKDGPALVDILKVLGPERVIARLQNVRIQCQ